MRKSKSKITRRHRGLPKSTSHLLVWTVILFLSIIVTTFVMQRQQDIRQRASQSNKQKVAVVTSCINAGGGCKATGTCDPTTETDAGPAQDCSTDGTLTCCIPNANVVPSSVCGGSQNCIPSTSPQPTDVVAPTDQAPVPSDQNALPSNTVPSDQSGLSPIPSGDNSGDNNNSSKSAEQKKNKNKNKKNKNNNSNGISQQIINLISQILQMLINLIKQLLGGGNTGNTNTTN